MARIPRPPRLEAVTAEQARAYARRPHPSDAEVRAQIIAEQMLRQLEAQIAASRASAPGPSISGYRFLSNLVGADIAALLPGTQTRTGGNPPFSAGGIASDILLLQPYLRGYRAWGRAAKAARARQPLREVIRAGRTRPAIAGPAARAGARPLAGPEWHRDDSERIDWDLRRSLERAKRLKQELERKRAYAAALANLQAERHPALRRRGGR
jgi:hypothetical protein